MIDRSTGEAVTGTSGPDPLQQQPLTPVLFAQVAALATALIRADTLDELTQALAEDSLPLLGCNGGSVSVPADVTIHAPVTSSGS